MKQSNGNIYKDYMHELIKTCTRIADAKGFSFSILYCLLLFRLGCPTLSLDTNDRILVYYASINTYLMYHLLFFCCNRDAYMNSPLILLHQAQIFFVFIVNQRYCSLT